MGTGGQAYRHRHTHPPTHTSLLLYLHHLHLVTSSSITSSTSILGWLLYLQRLLP